MLYREPEHWLDARAWLRSHGPALLRPDPLAGHDAAVRLLIEFGQLEAALTDHLLPATDAPLPQTRALRRLALHTGHRLRCSWRGLPPPQEGLAAEWRVLEEMVAPLEEPVAARVPEGFAFYGLYPETYLEAAERFARATPPDHACCIGLRTIGAPLSAVVAATLEDAGWSVTPLTLRPRGDPFARQPRLTPAFEALLRQHAEGYALIVDEGPGLSGSSFTGVADALRRLGFREQRIVYFPSWNPDAARLLSPEARQRWPRHGKWLVDFEESWITPGRLSAVPLVRLDSGLWRTRFFTPAHFPAVQPQHERRKYLSTDPAPRLFKFAGLGLHGDQTFRRAATLAEAGFTPPVHALRHGFLVHPFVPGRPLSSRDGSPSLIEHAARYFAFLQRSFPAPQPTSGSELRRMTEWHLREIAGLNVELHDAETIFEAGPAVRLDGRVQPWEWIRTVEGFLKTDAVDHHADHFFPGSTDVAWDVAGFAAEFGLDEAGTALLLRRFEHHSGDRRMTLRLPLFRLAYAAFHAGYARLAMQTTAGTDEASRFRRRERRFREELRRAFHALP